MISFSTPRKSLVLAATILAISGMIFGGAQNVYGTSLSFSQPYNLSNDLRMAEYPMVANSGSHVYVAWTEVKGGIFFRASSDNGTASSWSPPLYSGGLLLSSGAGKTTYPILQVNGSNVYVAWSQVLKGAEQVMLAYSHNYGESFSKPVQLTSGIGGAVTPVLAGYGSDVYMSYVNSSTQDSYVMASSNGGVNWGNPLLYGTYHEPQLAAWGNNSYAVSDHNLIVSNNNGETWTQITVSPTYGSEPWIAAFGSNVYVVWETKGHTSQIYTTVSNNNGLSWSTPLVISGAFKDAWAPIVSAWGNTAYVAWRTNPGSSSSEEYVTVSQNAGGTWSTPLAIGEAGHDNEWPFNIAVYGNNAFIMWGEQANATLNLWQPMVAYSGNSGLTWTVSNLMSGPDTGISAEADISTGFITAYGSTTFAVWQNATAGALNSQIYFASS